ncbi:hypothetical protein BN85411620 [Alteracholeplasma palmae J233]|uniref:Uncharacterized protein n=1 Tax=Alteracholeplasma palmae (strain ATCC 49389 / J233) TaxID=1318466 RepID=U4KLD7_ALTPJ|nr:hypothetical protein [Alteracholeplasma palmae]CCV64739.1 hypothetical protein BN85411620 [Alteracholeplasma palmae J233]
MEKRGLKIKIIYIIGCSFSLFIGLFHFSFPYLFSWYSYVPDIPYNLRVSIDYVNFFFSLLLSGLSILSIIVSKGVISRHKESSYIAYLLAVVWFFRVIINVILPSNGIYDSMFFGQFSMSLVIFLMILIPLILRKNYLKARLS